MQVASVLVAIGALVALAAAEDSINGCWKKSYGRGAGFVLSTCPAGNEKDGALCYPNCADGFDGVGPVCWQTCPSGFKDTGAHCLKPESYGRGAGYALWDLGKCESENPQGCEQNGLLYYPKCAQGFHAVGCCVCSPDCPSGWIDIGVSCQKGSYGRGAGTPLICEAGLEQNGALCYPPCSTDSEGKGPVCWQYCPKTWFDCGGALCTENADQCNSFAGTLAEGVAKAVGQIAVGLLGGEIDTAEVAESIADVGSALGHGLCADPSPI